MRAWLSLLALGLGGCLFLSHRDSEGSGGDATAAASGTPGGASPSSGGSGGIGGDVGSGAAGGDGSCPTFGDIDGLCLLGTVDPGPTNYFADAMTISNEAIFFTVREASLVNVGADAVLVYRVDRDHPAGQPFEPMISYAKEDIMPADKLRSYLGMRPIDDVPLISFAGADWYQPVGPLGNGRVNLPAPPTAFAFAMGNVFTAVNNAPVVVRANADTLVNQPMAETTAWLGAWVGTRALPAPTMAIGVRERGPGDNGAAVCSFTIPSEPRLLLFASDCAGISGKGHAFDFNNQAVYARTLFQETNSNLFRVDIQTHSATNVNTNSVGPIAATDSRVWLADANSQGGPTNQLLCRTPDLQSCPDGAVISPPGIVRITAIAVEPNVDVGAVFFLADVDHPLLGRRVALFRYRG